MKLETLNDLFIEQLKDLYSAESQLIEAMPKMQEKATSTELQQAITMHLNETIGQRERLKKIFADLGKDPGGHKCKAMEGLLKEGEELMKQNADPDVMDAGLIAAAQRIEHYEISGYGTASTYAKQLGHELAHKLLKESINEEKMADEKLSIIAESTVNLEAEH